MKIEIGTIGEKREKRVVRTVTVKGDVWEDIKQIATQKNTSTSRIVEDLIIAYVNEYKKAMGLDGLKTVEQ
jgi:hypothetical protein